ncbi:Radical SAM domain-containing protein [Bifidobacterium cuniculi]|uniref:Radical SAM domain-containing protein n=2 Tax=Bifidobacterium cuniculi TaxID=1688 RepID=A0A087ATE0_9BIFI|nr:Radical SAM domain-containing protein [Bifidobacterium cuniculi]
MLYFTLRPSLLLIPATDAQALLSTAFSPAQDNYDTYEEMGLLTSLTAQQELQQIIHQFKQGTPGTRIFALMPTSLCNMCCSYCGQNNCALRFSANTAASIQERIKVALSQPNLEAIETRWYGGEPLMAYHEILRLSHEIIPAARKHELKYRATMSTNGSLMTYKRLRCLYDEALLRSLVVTIDGYGNYHDTSRVMRSGRPTYEWITRDCPMLPVCGGSCPKRWHEGVGNCPAYARQLQLRLDLLAQSYGLERAD